MCEYILLCWGSEIAVIGDWSGVVEKRGSAWSKADAASLLKIFDFTPKTSDFVQKIMFK